MAEKTELADKYSISAVRDVSCQQTPKLPGKISAPHRLVDSITTPSTGSIKTKRKRESMSEGRLDAVKLAPNPFNMTGRNFPKRRNFGKSAAILSRTRASTNNNPAKALELVRSAMQHSLNTDIERVLQSYQEMFRMAAYNISDNLKEPVTEDHVKYILRRSLDEAKSLFKVENKNEEDSVPKAVKAAKIKVPIRQAIIKKRKIRRDEHYSREKPKDDYNYPPWDEARLTEETELIMGVKANKILGFASARGRLYTRHPDLFKYTADQDDKQWLFENGHMPITGGKAFLMIADDIRNLATTHQDYKDNLGIKREDIKGYLPPPAMMEKIKVAMKKAAILREVTKKPAPPLPSV
eukprot:gene11883-13116_t